MTEDTGKHKPTPEFRDELEGQISRALRREAGVRRGLGRTYRPLGFPVRAINVAVVVLAMFAGAIIGAAPSRIQDSRQRDLLLGSAQADERVAAMRVALAREAYEVASRQAALGTVATTAPMAAEAELREAEARLAVIRLNMEEIRATASLPRDDLSAPIVGGRDFVKERLNLHLAAARFPLRSMEAQLEVATLRLELDLVTDVEVAQRRIDLAQVTGRIDVLAQKVALRERFVSRGIAAAVVERLARGVELRYELTIAEQRLQAAAAGMSHVRAQQDAGVGSRADLLKAELQVLELQAMVDRLRLQLRMVDSTSAT
jgi:hypothetical protein